MHRVLRRISLEVKWHINCWDEVRVRIEREHSPEYVAVFSIGMSVWPVQRYTVYMNWNGLIAAYTTRYVGRGPVQTCPPLQQQPQRSGHYLSLLRLFWPAQSFAGTQLWQRQICDFLPCTLSPQYPRWQHPEKLNPADNFFGIWKDVSSQVYSHLSIHSKFK